MTVGIAVIIPEAVVLVADSRKSWPFDKGKSPVDDSEKIHVFNDKLAVISFGITQVTDIAVRLLHNQTFMEKSIPSIVSNVENSMQVAWESVSRRLDSGADKSHSSMRSALVVGGLLGAKPYLAGILRDFSTPKPPTLQDKHFGYIVLGGESVDAQDVFHANLLSRLEKSNHGIHTFSDILVETVLNAAKDTIVFVEKDDHTVGGPIHYLLLRSGHNAKKGILRS
jgi:hypothetical protein